MRSCHAATLSRVAEQSAVPLKRGTKALRPGRGQACLPEPHGLTAGWGKALVGAVFL